MYEHFEHTADVGLRVVAPDREGLFRDAAEGLFALIVEKPPPSPSPEPITIRVAGERDDYLLFDWLCELLVIFDTRHLLLSDFEIEIGPRGLEAQAQARPFDPRRHRSLHEVKAITYHCLRIEQTASGWLAEVIVDI